MTKSEKSPAKRFSTRAAYYDQYRPGYPAELLGFLKDECGFSPSSVVADIGSGTGILSRLFLRNGNTVFCVEPNKEMREIAEDLLKQYPEFKSVNGFAEATELDEDSVDFITVGQAFHWFDTDKSKLEFRRILKPGGWVIIVWNDRKTDATPFLKAYEDLLLSFGTDYKEADCKNFETKTFVSFFGKDGYRLKTFDNFQIFDYEALKGRLHSSSYVPTKDEPGYVEMIKELHSIFVKHQSDGKVVFEYDTKAYYGRIE